MRLGTMSGRFRGLFSPPCVPVSQGRIWCDATRSGGVHLGASRYLSSSLPTDKVDRTRPYLSLQASFHAR